MSGTVPTATVMPPRITQWIDLFRAVLAQCLGDQPLLLATVAKRLTTSARTLQRMLDTEGTSWRAEVDAMRRAQACQLLAGGMSKAQAAVRLGYSDARALRRAVRRWERQCQSDRGTKGGISCPDLFLATT